MFERDFIKVTRSGDDGTVYIRKEEIMAFCDNADESGIIEGSTAMYLKGGLAYALNHTVAEIAALIIATEIVQ